MVYEVAATCLLYFEPAQIGLQSGSHACCYGTKYRLLAEGIGNCRGTKRYSPIVVRGTTNWTGTIAYDEASGSYNSTLSPPIDVASLIPKRSAEAVSKHTLGLDDYIN